MPEGAPEHCRGGAPEGVCRRGAAVGNRRMPWEASYVGGDAPEGCAIAMPRGCQIGRQSPAERVRRRGVPEGAAVGNRRMPLEASYVGGG